MSNAVTTQASRTLTIDRTGRLAALRRRWPTGVGIAAASVSVALLTPLPEPVRAWIGAWCVLSVAVIYLAWGTARGQLGQRRWLSAQTAGVLGFAGVAITAVAVGLPAGRYVLAAGWLAHAVWDVVHHRAERVVPRWYAEACMVADLSIAAVLLAVGVV